jgi:predicted enzyme related to lactoylglutathione lyase
VADVEAAKSFYAGYLGLSTEEFNMGWVARYTSPGTGASVQLVTRDESAPEDSVISVHTDDLAASRALVSSLRTNRGVAVPLRADLDGGARRRC